MADNSGELAAFTEQVATALFRAVDARPDKGRGIGGTVTVGAWLDPDTEPLRPKFAPGRERSARESYLTKRELRKLSPGGPVTRASVGKFAESIGDDTELALDVARSLISDPTNWDELFDLDDDIRAQFDEGDDDFIGLFEGVIDRFIANESAIDEVILDIKPPSTRAKKDKPKKSRPAWLPDKVTIEGGVETKGGEESGKVVIKFEWEL